VQSASNYITHLDFNMIEYAWLNLSEIVELNAHILSKNFYT